MYMLNLSAFNSSAVENATDVVASIQSEIATREFDFIEKNRAIKNVDPASFGLVTEINEKEKIFVNNLIYMNKFM
jgi:hypothetical protein